MWLATNLLSDCFVHSELHTIRFVNKFEELCFHFFPIFLFWFTLSGLWLTLCFQLTRESLEEINDTIWELVRKKIIRNLFLKSWIIPRSVLYFIISHRYHTVIHHMLEHYKPILFPKPLQESFFISLFNGFHGLSFYSSNFKLCCNVLFFWHT